jgi:hypothetical protein
MANAVIAVILGLFRSKLVELLELRIKNLLSEK